MNKKRFLLILLGLFGGMAIAQTGTLKGNVTDSAGKSVEAAVIQVENTKYKTFLPAITLFW